MRLVLIGFMVLALLSGAGAGAYFYFFQQAEASGAGADEIADAHNPSDSSSVEFVEFDPMVVPVVDGNGVSQVISLVIGVETYSYFGSEKVEKLMPKLKNAYLKDLYGILNRYAALKGGILEVNLIKERLGKITDQVLGEDVVHGVKLKVVQQRPV